MSHENFTTALGVVSVPLAVAGGVVIWKMLTAGEFETCHRAAKKIMISRTRNFFLFWVNVVVVMFITAFMFLFSYRLLFVAT